MDEMTSNGDLTTRCHFRKVKGNGFGNHFNDLDIYSGKDVKSTCKKMKRFNGERVST